MQSLTYAERFAGKGEDDLVVVGRFTQTDERSFLHLDQLDELRGMYWPRSDSTMMPMNIEYWYRSAFRFDGSQIVDGSLVPFSSTHIDACVSISAEYEGIVDQLPVTDQDVIGVLHLAWSSAEYSTYELSASVCPSYDPAKPAQLQDLLACYREGECQ